MSYVDGYVIPVPKENVTKYTNMAIAMGAIFKEFGALQVFEGWGDDVPEGKVTSFPMAVKLEPDENVVFSFIVWPSKAARDSGSKSVMADPRIQKLFETNAFDLQRMIWGGFSALVEL